MNKLMTLAGDTTAVAGTLLCLLAGAARIFGRYDIAGLSTITLFTVGVGIMVFACLAKLHLLTLQGRGAAGKSL